MGSPPFQPKLRGRDAARAPGPSPGRSAGERHTHSSHTNCHQLWGLRQLTGAPSASTSSPGKWDECPEASLTLVGSLSSSTQPETRISPGAPTGIWTGDSPSAKSPPEGKMPAASGQPRGEGGAPREESGQAGGRKGQHRGPTQGPTGHATGRGLSPTKPHLGGCTSQRSRTFWVQTVSPAPEPEVWPGSKAQVERPFNMGARGPGTKTTGQGTLPPAESRAQPPARNKHR